MLPPPLIMTARHAHPGVNTPEDYRRLQADVIAKGQRLYPNLPWRDPWVCEIEIPIFISGGKWLIECPCRNCPLVAPGWGALIADADGVLQRRALALCLDCGAMYDHLIMPAEAEAIEAALIPRAILSHRYWNPELRVLDLLNANEAGTFELVRIEV